MFRPSKCQMKWGNYQLALRSPSCNQVQQASNSRDKTKIDNGMDASTQVEGSRSPQFGCSRFPKRYSRWAV